MTESLLEKHAPHLMPQVFAAILRKKAEAGMLDDTELAKAVVDGHGSFGKTRQYFERAIAKRADETRLEGESDARAYVRVMESPDGRALFAASKRAPAEDEIQDEVEPQKPRSKGVAHDELEAKAQEHRLAHYPISIEAARSYVYTHPDNVGLRERVKAEHFAGIRAMRAGRREQAASNTFARENDQAAYARAERRPSVSDPR